MAELNGNSTINIKTSTALAVVAFLVTSVCGWFLQEAYRSNKATDQRQWEVVSDLKDRVTRLEAAKDFYHGKGTVPDDH